MAHGHGNPVPITMMVPTTPELLRAGIAALRRLILDHRRFVFVASEPADRLLLTLGMRCTRWSSPSSRR